MKTLILILFLLLPQQQDEYKWGKPTSKGVDNYVERNEYQFVIDYQNHIKDTLFLEPFISTDDLTRYYEYSRGESGYYERPDNIIIDNNPNYVDYELRRLNPYRRNQYVEVNKFVRGVVMHELTHCYFYQNELAVQFGDSLHRDYREGLRMIPTDNYFTEFIEEGFCEWVAADMDEIIPRSEEVLVFKKDMSRQSRNTYRIKYSYARQFVAPIIERYGLRDAIRVVVSQPAPTEEEILKPQRYYDRL